MSAADHITDYMAQMWDALHLTPEQRAQMALDNLKRLAESLATETEAEHEAR